jgi:hypothetical protein
MLKFDWLKLSQERFNGLSFLLAASALAVSAITLFANGTPNWMRGAQYTVYVPAKLPLAHSLGYFGSVIPVSLVNTGGTDIHLRSVSLELLMEDGRKIELHGDSWSPPGASFYALPGGGSTGERQLVDVVVRPNATWTGNVYLNEQLPTDRRDQIEDVKAELLKASRLKTRQQQNAISEILSKIAISVGNSALPVAVNAGNSLGYLPCERAPTPIYERAAAVTNRSTNRLTKGQHQAVLKVVSSKSLIHNQSSKFVLYEREIRGLFDPESNDVAVCVSADYNNPDYRIPTNTLRLDLAR